MKHSVRFWLVVGCVWILSAGPVSGQASGSTRDGAQAPRDVSRSLDASQLRDEGSGAEILRAPGLSKGVDSIIAAIRKREVELARREQKIAERERAVVELESKLESRATEVDRIRAEVERRISEWVSQGQDRVAQLASVYASMPPAKAGTLLNKLDLDLAVSVIRAMKKKSSAGVLAAMRPDRALLVSRRLLKPLDPKADAPASKR